VVPRVGGCHRSAVLDIGRSVSAILDRSTHPSTLPLRRQRPPSGDDVRPGPRHPPHVEVAGGGVVLADLANRLQQSRLDPSPTLSAGSEKRMLVAVHLE
jgi:hypothetical protein